MKDYEITKYEKKEGKIDLPRRTLDQLVKVTIDTFGPGMGRNEVEEHVFAGDLLYVASDIEGMVGFASAEFNYEDHSLSLAGAVVHPKVQKHGIYKDFTALRIKDGLEKNYFFINTTTQNPKIEYAIRSVLEDFVSSEAIKGFLLHRKRIHSLYGRMLTSEIPLSKDKNLNELYSKLNYSVGDAYSLSFNLTGKIENKGSTGDIYAGFRAFEEP